MTLPLIFSSVLFSSEQLQSLAIVIEAYYLLLTLYPLPILFNVLT
jgi:hypothetical protein